MHSGRASLSVVPAAGRRIPLLASKLGAFALLSLGWASVARAEEPDVEAKSAKSSNAVSTSGSAAAVSASDASWRVHGTLGLTKAVTGHQREEYGFGVGGLAALEWGPSAVWGLQAEVGLLSLLGVDQAPPAGLSALGGATGTHIAGGVRVKPFAKTAWANPKGFWLSAAAGLEVTGGHAAPMLDAFLGYDFYLNERFGLGPTAGYALILETRDVPRPDNANIVLVGVHGTFDFRKMAPKITDRDHDGILDPSDQCPDDPEDKDGFQDEDGCPDLDNDQDKILDLVDHCPNDPEDLDQFEDENGCPDLDNDQDTVPDAVDECPLQPEDLDDFEDEDGCPDLDNDLDQIPDLKDLCPNEPEVRNGIADNDGCPDAESVRVVGDKIELDQKIHFWTNSDRIRAMSYPVLEKLAAFLLDHPEYVHVDIEGHADARGDEDYNVDLSGRRARSILEFMVKRGMDEARLSSEGFGSSRPLVDGKDEHSLFMNRRVEFVVTRNRKVRLNPETGQEMGAAGKIEEAPAFGRDHDDLSAVSAESAAADSEAGTPDESAVDTSQSEPSDAPSPTEKRGSAP